MGRTMVNVSISRRYARALMEVSTENASLDSVGEQLNTLAETMEKNRELAAVMRDPAYTRAQRQAVADELLKVASVSDGLLKNLIHLLVDRSRMVYLPDIARSFRTLADAKAGRLRGQVASAVPLAPEAVKKIEQALERLTQRHVVLETRVDPSLLGGVAAQVGSTVYDGTLQSQLRDLHRTLTDR